MNTPRFHLEITRPRTEGKTLAFIKVKVGPVWISCRLDQSGDRYFLNPPSNFVESLQGREMAGGRTHSGWINTAGFEPEFAEAVKQKALQELGILAEVA
jgi:hypothetical protein